MLQERLTVLPQGLAAADAHLRHCLVLHCALKSPGPAGTKAMPLVLRCPRKSPSTEGAGAVSSSKNTGLTPAGAACASIPQLSSLSQNSTKTFDTLWGCCADVSAPGSGDALGCAGVPLNLMRGDQADDMPGSAVPLTCTRVRTNTDASSCEGTHLQGSGWADATRCDYKSSRERDRHEVGAACHSSNRGCTALLYYTIVGYSIMSLNVWDLELSLVML